MLLPLPVQPEGCPQCTVYVYVSIRERERESERVYVHVVCEMHMYCQIVGHYEHA